MPQIPVSRKCALEGFGILGMMHTPCIKSNLELKRLNEKNVICRQDTKVQGPVTVQHYAVSNGNHAHHNMHGISEIAPVVAPQN